LLSSAAKRNAENAIADLPIYDFRTIGVFLRFYKSCGKIAVRLRKKYYFCFEPFKILKKGEFSFFSFFVRNHNKKNYEKMRKPRRKRLTSTELCAIIFSGVGKTRLFFVLWLAVANRLCRPDGFRNTSGRIKGKTTGKITAKKKKSRDRT